MSVLITECANRLAAKFEKIAADDGKFNAKTYTPFFFNNKELPHV